MTCLYAYALRVALLGMSLPAAAQITQNTFLPGPVWPLVSRTNYAGFIPSATADYNADGAVDLIDVTGEVFQNDGRGVFTSVGTLIELASVPGDGVAAGAAADLDGDGDLDFVGYTVPGRRAQPTDSALLEVYHNDGLGHLTPVTPVRVPWRVWEIALQDVNKDSRPDIVFLGASDSARQVLGVRLNDVRTNTFSGFNQILPGRGKWRYPAMRFADFDNNGRVDLALNLTRITRNGLTDSLYYWLGFDGTPRALPRGQARAISQGRLLAVDDFDTDGDIDLLAGGFVGTQPVGEWLVNDSTAQFTSQVIPLSLVVPNRPMTGLQALDLDGDTDLDLLVTDSARLQITENQSNRSFSAAELLHQVGSSTPLLVGVSVGDVDADADLDLIIDYYENGSNYARVLFNQTNMPPPPTGLAASAVAATVRLFPNPAHHQISIEITPNQEVQSVQIVDALGRPVQTTAFAPRTSHLELDLPDLTPGVYTVRVGAAARRLVVE